MRIRFTTLALAVPLVGTVLADQVIIRKHLGDDCFYCCTGTLTSVTFGDVPETALTYYAKLAESNYFMTSLAACIDTYCKRSVVQYRGALAGWEHYVGYALEYGPNVVMPSYDEIEAKMPAASDIKEVDTLSLGATDILNSTIVPSQAAYIEYMRTLDAWNLEIFLAHTFGYCLYLILALMILVGLTGRFYSWITYRPPKREEGHLNRSEIAPSTSWATRLFTRYRKYVETPALFGYRHSTPAYGYFSIPTRLQGFFIFLYVALNIIWCSVGYVAFEDNQYWPGDIPAQVWRYVADRTGIMCFWNLPLLWLFAGRNDFLMWITGWSFSSFNLMHRWVARVAVVQAIVHSIGYTWIERDYYATEWADLYWRCGIFATVLMSLLIPLSMLPLRRYYYEIFLVTHILFAAVIIPLLWYHVAIFDGQYAPFLWACIGVWVFDRVLRLIRLKVLSGHSFTGKNAVATLTGNDNGLIRLTVNTPFKIRPQPGQYFFLYNPRSLAPWENHPFTLASWEQEEKSTKLHFLIAVQSGATRRLKRKINPSVPTEMKVLLEGPYGHTEPVERYEHVLFVAGGSGITAMLPYLHSLKNNFCTRTATVVWAVKDNAYASDVLANELRSSGAEIILHVTEEEQPGVATLTRGDQPLNEAAEGSGEKHVPPENKSTSSGSTISFKVGRPTMETLVKTHAGRLVGSERLAIVSCGPAAMMDDMRKAVTDVYGIKEGQVNGSAVDYYEELFSW